MDPNARAFKVTCSMCNGARRAVGNRSDTKFGNPPRYVRYRFCDKCDRG